MAKFKRLPDYAIPLHYDLNLVTSLTNFNFDGVTTIKVTILRPNVECLILNALDLEVRSVTVQGDVAEFVVRPERETLEVKLAKSPQQNEEIALKIVYQVRIRNICSLLKIEKDIVTIENLLYFKSRNKRKIIVICCVSILTNVLASFVTLQKVLSPLGDLTSSFSL